MAVLTLSVDASCWDCAVVSGLPVLKFLVLLGLEPLLVGHVTELSYFWSNKQVEKPHSKFKISILIIQNI